MTEANTAAQGNPAAARGSVLRSCARLCVPVRAALTSRPPHRCQRRQHRIVRIPSPAPETHQALAAQDLRQAGGAEVAEPAQIGRHNRGKVLRHVLNRLAAAVVRGEAGGALGTADNGTTAWYCLVGRSVPAMRGADSRRTKPPTPTAAHQQPAAHLRRPSTHLKTASAQDQTASATPAACSLPAGHPPPQTPNTQRQTSD